MPAATLDVTVQRDVWIKGVSKGQKGLFSNPSPFLMYYRKAESLPSADVLIGHPLDPDGDLPLDMTDVSEMCDVYFRLKPNCHASETEGVFSEA